MTFVNLFALATATTENTTMNPTPPVPMPPPVVPGKPKLSQIIPGITPQRAFEVISESSLKNCDFTRDDFKPFYVSAAKIKGWNADVNDNMILSVFDGSADSLKTILYIESIGQGRLSQYRLTERGLTAADTGHNVWNTTVVLDASVAKNQRANQILESLLEVLTRFKSTAINATVFTERAYKLSRSLPDIFAQEGSEMVCVKMRQIVNSLTATEDGKPHGEQYLAEMTRLFGALNSHISDIEGLFTIHSFERLEPKLIISFSVPAEGFRATALNLNDGGALRILDNIFDKPDGFLKEPANVCIEYAGTNLGLLKRSNNVFDVISEDGISLFTFAFIVAVVDVSEPTEAPISATVDMTAALRRFITSLRQALLEYNKKVKITIYHAYAEYLVERLDEMLILQVGAFSNNELYTRLSSLPTLAKDHFPEAFDGSQAAPFRSDALLGVCEVADNHFKSFAARYPEVAQATS